MLVGRLTISFERGVRRNNAKDVGLDVDPTRNEPIDATAPIVRGLGTHYVSAEARDKSKACEAEDRRIRALFARYFAASPIPGLCVLTDYNAGDELLKQTEIREGIKVRCVVYDLAPGGQLPTSEVKEWTDRLRRQLMKAPLGRAENAAAEGLDVLERLAACPVLSAATKQTLSELIASARLDKVGRKDFKRSIAAMAINVDLGAPVQPRRMRPAMAGA